MTITDVENIVLSFIAVSSTPYLIGSIPFGLIIGKLGGAGDIRRIGSGNIGATNMLRTGKKGLALFTLLLDAFKGFFAVMLIKGGIATIANLANPEDNEMILKGHDVGMLLGCGGGLLAVIGHIFPVWLKFKGGKGVATTFGVYFALMPITGLIAAITWLATFALTRISSLSALLAMGLAPFAAWWFYGIIPGVTALLLAILIFAKHKDNIVRLLRGEETVFKR